MTDSSLDGPALQRRDGQLSVLNDVARTLNASIDLPTVLQRALERVAELLGLHTGWVLLFDEATGEPYTAASLNLPAGFEREPARMNGWCHCLESYRRGDLSGAANVGVVACSRLRQLELARGDTAGLHFHASVPLRVSGADTAGDGVKRLGMLNVASPEWRQLGEVELRLLRTIGDMLGVAIERARLHERRLEGAQTEERNRLAREIHDTIAQDFSAIGFQLETAEALLAQGADPERLRAAIAAALELTRKGLEETRRSVLGLRAASLEGRTLAEALAALAAEADRSAVSARPVLVFEAPAPIGPLPPAVELGLYRIAGEALQNALRHAEADRITLRLERLGATLHDPDATGGPGASDGSAPRGIRLTVEDDGRGFDTETVCDERSEDRFGLLGMCERARLMGARIELETAPGVGTRITVEVDLDV